MNMHRSKLPIVILLISSLIVAGFTRHWASAERSSGPGALPAASSTSGLSRMNSYALALLLGGLRGPLVMFLWPSAEDQKNEKNLEDFDTKIEWIRLLQAEFDTVHIFQIWNKAYNISAQMASLSNKYRTILDAIDYAQNVNAEKPDDINIIYAIAGLYFEKLGTSAEKEYYRPRVREETMARQPQVRLTLPLVRQSELTELLANSGISASSLRFSEADESKMVSVTIPKSLADSIKSKFSGTDVVYADRPQIQLNHNDPSWRRTQLDPMLDANGNILPELLTPTRNTRERQMTATPGHEFNDGSELQYLKRYQPFPSGISTLALGYNYYKQAQVLSTERKQKHAQISDETIGSRPGFALKTWSEEQWTRGRRAELEAFGRVIPENPILMEAMTAATGFDAPLVRPARLTDAINEYAMGIRLVDDSLAEYDRHNSISKINFSLYLVHMADLAGEKQLLLGDKAYLEAFANPANRATKSAEAIAAYRQAIQIYQTTLMEHFIDEEDAKAIFPPGVTRANLSEKKLPAEQLDVMYDALLKRLPPQLTEYDTGDEVNEYSRYISRAKKRIDLLK